MRRIALITATLLAPLWAYAQSQEEDEKGYLTKLIEENLSGVSREVSILGFRGALSSQATIDVLTVADADGVWLTLEDIVLQWNRGALLSGAIDVQELRAARIVVARPPLSEYSGPAPEAQPFTLPELPVSIALDQLAIDRIELGEAFLGEDIAISLQGTASLGGGEGAANVTARRLGDKTGLFEINGRFANETQVLGLLLNLEEGSDGIVSRLLDLPGQPAVALSVTGDAPIDDFSATLAITTDGVDRVSGGFTMISAGGGRRVSLDIGGDIAPFFAPDYQEFFGTEASLQAEVIQSGDGRVDVPVLELDAGQLTLSGAVEISASGWPDLIDLSGGISARDNEPVLIPLSGPRTFVDGAELVVTYDAAQADNWRADITLDGLTRPGLVIDRLSMQGGGILRPGGGQSAITADLRYGAAGLTLDDAGASLAFGDRIDGAFTASRLGGGPVEVSQLTLSGAGLEAQVTASIDGAASGFATDATIKAEIAGLERFSTLIGQDISGAAAVNVLARLTPLEGLFDITLSGVTNDLAIGVAQADRVLAGQGTVSAKAVRDADGTRLEALRVQSNAAGIDARADLRSTGTTADVTARLNDAGLVVDGMSGPATVTGHLTQEPDGVLLFDVTGTGPAVRFAADGSVNPAETGQTINADLSATFSDLSRYATLARRPLSGAVTLEAVGVLLSDGQRFDVGISGTTRDLVTGTDRIDPLLSGTGVFNAAIARVGKQAINISDLLVETPAMSLTGDADLRREGSQTADLAFTVNDTALLDPSLSGPIALTLLATPAPRDATATRVRLSGAGTAVAIDATLGSATDDYAVTGDVSAQVSNLAAFADLTGQPIAGSIDLAASGSVLPDLSRFDTQLNLRSEDLAIGNPTADALLRGTGRINATIGLADDILAIRTLEVSTPELSVVGALNGAAGVGQGRFNASLRDVGVLTDQISGPIRATGGASLDEAGNWGIDANGTGPGGLGATIVGQIRQNGTLDIDLSGSAPLALANTAIEPRRLSGTTNFDLQVNGPPALTSLSGEITFANGRLAAPNLGEALTDIGGQIALGNSRAQIDITTRVESGGRVNVRGPIALTSGNQANINIALRNVLLQDPALYSSRVTGEIALAGPLAGGALISGDLELGQTDVQVPSSAIGTLGPIPEVAHIGASAPVHQTLQRAGLLAVGTAENAGNDVAFPLDIRIDAPSRIFIRGRGLDAELGGSITIGGTTANVVPVGQFALVRGRIDILQQRFDLTEGTATLQGDFDPFVRLVATTETDTGTVIDITLEGSASEPQVSFTSVPELPQDEVLSQLIFGRDLQSISPLQAVQLASAISTLAGGGGALGRFRESLGLDDLDVTTDEEGTAAVRVGAYLSGNIYTDVTVTSEGETEINLNLDITDEITARGGLDQAGDTSVGLFFERDY